MKEAEKIETLNDEVVKFIIENPGLKVGEIKKSFPQYASRKIDAVVKRAYAEGLISRRSDNNLHYYCGPDEMSIPVYSGKENINKYLGLKSKAKELEERGLWRRAGSIWLDAFSVAPSDRECSYCANRRRYCLNHYARCRGEAQNSGTSGVFSGDLPVWA